VTTGLLTCNNANGNCPPANTQSCYEGFTVQKGAFGATPTTTQNYANGYACNPVCSAGMFPELLADCSGAAFVINSIRCVEPSVVLVTPGNGIYWRADNTAITAYTCCPP
jgi:hypothetical protein